MINEDFKKKMKKESKRREVDRDNAWDDVDYVDLDIVNDFMEKCLAIRAGKDYDTRVQMAVDFSDEDLFKYMKMAHERDITLNQLIENALREEIERRKELDAA
jgi:hypothetical protein